MNRLLAFIGICAVCNSQSCSAGAPLAQLKLYESAPEFQSVDDTGTPWKSPEHITGANVVVVYFYPADMTPGCTKQACGFRDAMGELSDRGVRVVGVSGDSARNHQLFKKAHKLNFTLLADEDGRIAKKFGVPLRDGASIERTIDGKGEKLTRGVTAARWTFIIGDRARIVFKNTGVNAAEDAKAVLAFLDELEKIKGGGEPPNWQEDLPEQENSRWKMHDLGRPFARAVSPGSTASAAPGDAVVLFDGKDLSKWRDADGGPAGWIVKGGVMELNGTGDLYTRDQFGDCQLHVEWATPATPHGRSQHRGNSGFFFMDRYEVQVLDSYESRTYADGQAAAIYGQRPPLVNASRAPGEFQSYDIIFRAPRFRDDQLVEPARATVIHNGVLVQYDSAFTGATAWRKKPRYQVHGPKGPLRIQDHGDGQPMRFRNIWVRPVDFDANE